MEQAKRHDVIRAVRSGCGHYLPARVVENAEFEATLDTSDEWIRSRSGIERRHFAAPGEMTSHLAIEAARAALANAGSGRRSRRDHRRHLDTRT
jgi:3-oxoacyl-[acyl-carrier-protein] synthase III